MFVLFSHLYNFDSQLIRKRKSFITVQLSTVTLQLKYKNWKKLQTYHGIYRNRCLSNLYLWSGVWTRRPYRSPVSRGYSHVTNLLPLSGCHLVHYAGSE